MWTRREENCSTRGSLCHGRRGRTMLLAAVCCGLLMGVADRAAAQDCIDNCPAPGENHNFGVNFQKGCPVTAGLGETVTCTFTIENNDECHRVDILDLTDQVPFGVTGFPDGPVVPLVGCATSLAPSDGVQGSGADFTTCDITFTIPNDPDLCDGVWLDQGEVDFQDFCVPVLTDTNQASGIIVIVCECGDDIVNSPDESCDGADAGTVGCTTADSGENSACRDDCTCCGDGLINGGEQCDGTASMCPGGGICQADCTCPPVGGEGCTPGYWKLVYGDSRGAHHECNWTDPHDPDDLFENTCAPCGGDAACFADAFNDYTLIQVLDQPKDIRPAQLRNLGFHAVASLLNAASPDVQFGLSVCDVIEGFNGAYADFVASGDKADLADAHRLFSSFNECGAETCADDALHCCPLSNCRCEDSKETCCPGCEDGDAACPAGESCGGRDDGFQCGDDAASSESRLRATQPARK